MTAEIALVLLILAAAMVLFVTEWIRMDLVALLVLGATALTGLVDAGEAFAGFSNPAVITVWGMFMLSAALTRTGIAAALGSQVLRLVGRGEVRAIVVIMATSAFLSAFMNNIGVAALLLPVVMDIARRTGRSPSRLLMPLAYGCLLGGLTTLIGTPPNLIASQALSEAGLEGFRLFDFAPLGVIVASTGIVFIAAVGRWFLPARKPVEVQTSDGTRLFEQYGLQERAVVLRIRPGSALIGRPLAAARLGSAAAINVVALLRDGVTYPAPAADVTLKEEDRLLVSGRLDRFRELKGWSDLVVEREQLGLEDIVSDEIGLAELRVAADASVAGRTIGESNFRRRFDVIVLALGREEATLFDDLTQTTVRAGDRLLVQGRHDRLQAMVDSDDFEGVEALEVDTLRQRYGLAGQIFTVRVPEDSILVGRSLAQARLGDAFRLGVLGIVREQGTRLLPEPEMTIAPGDRLIVRGKAEDVTVLRGLQELELESERMFDLAALESDEIGMYEVMLSPRSRLSGRTLRELFFREKYGFSAVAVLRQGRSIRSELRDLQLRFGDALLLLGPRARLNLIADDSDFLVLTGQVSQPVRSGRAPLALTILAVALGAVLLGWLPISIASVVAASLMVLFGCLTMDEAYRSIEWRSIFLIAGMLPLGRALADTGAATFLADQLLNVLRDTGPWGVIAGLYVLTALATMIVPTAALVVLMAPIVLRASTELGVSPRSVMMAVAIAASASFTSPISHPANLLVMGPGGYRFSDYFRIGVPLTIVLFVVTMLLLPWIWPL